jgi:vancomycin resistance protein YoaR
MFVVSEPTPRQQYPQIPGQPGDDRPTQQLPAIDAPTEYIPVVDASTERADAGFVPADDAPTEYIPAVDDTAAYPYVPNQLAAAAQPVAAPNGAKRRVLGMRTPVFAAVAAVVGLALVGGALTAVDAKDQVPMRTTVLGVNIGGRSVDEAAETLTDQLGGRLMAPVTVHVGGKTTTVDPETSGLQLDAEATAENAATAGTNPIKLLTGREVAPVVTVDAGKLAAAVAPTVKKAGHAMTLPKITYSGLTPKATYPVSGSGLDEDGAAAAMTAGWLRQAEITLPLDEIKPKTSAADVNDLITSLAAPAVAKAVTVTTDKGDFTISRAAIAKSLVFSADKTGKLTPKVSESKLRTAIESQLGGIEVEPRNAEVRAADGTVKIVASQGGRLVDTKSLAKDLLGVLAKASGRTVNATLTEVSAKTTASDLTKLGIKERVSSFTTYYSGGEDRNRNIIQVAKEVDGAVVKPGETFSLNGYTGERSYAQGYVDAPVILDGKLVNAVGGGISQFTTTLFNASYYAGMQDVYHKPHSYYISRYPSVIESTIYYPTLDMKFRNNTPYGLLIDTKTTSDSVTVTMWSTKIYDSVTTEYGPRTGVTQPKTVHVKDSGCVASVGGIGFAQDAWRVIKQGGTVVSKEKFSWKYDAEPHFVCDK